MILRFTFAVALIFTVLTAQASDEYVFILRARGNPYWQTMASGIRDTAQAKGIEAKIFMLENETASEEQLNQAEAISSSHPKILVLSATTESVGITILKKAQDRGIIVAEMDSSLDYEAAKKAGINLAFSVGSDNFKIGQRAAQFADELPNGGKQWKDRPKNDSFKVLILEGAPGAIAGKARVDGFTAYLKQNEPQYQIVASTSAMWDRLQAMNITNDILQRYPDLYLIFCANDVMALGAVEAVRTAGKEGQVKIIGIDGTADARKALMEGKLAATVAQLPYLIGVRAVELAIAKVKGKPVNPIETTPTPVLTKELLQAGTEPLLKYVR